jgi:hypothetical protein
MRLSIIPSDGTVCEDSVCYTKLTWEGTPSDVHALQWFDTEGWIEYIDPSVENETITSLPQWTNNAMDAWTVANTPAPILPPTAEQNKATASGLLSETDWTTIPDVADPAKSNPYLTNVDEFLVYRNAVRQYAINPVAGDIDWPIVPNSVWATV